MIDTVKVDITRCDLIACDVSEKHGTEDSCYVGYYTHLDNSWDVVATDASFDSVKYTINDTLIISGASATLENVRFPAYVTNEVVAIAYYENITDTCIFNVTIAAAGVSALANEIVAENDTICIGSTATLRASSAIGSPTFLWYESQNSTNVLYEGANYVTSALFIDTAFYVSVYGVGKCENLVETRKRVRVIIDPLSVKGHYTAGDATICFNTGTTISIEDYLGTIQWQDSTSGFATKNIPDANDPDLIISNLQQTTWYRAVITSGVCASVLTDYVKVTVDPLSVEGVTSRDTTICFETSATIRVTGTTGTIQWQDSVLGVPFKNISGENGSVLITEDLIETTWFRAKVANGVCDTVYSGVIQVTVNLLTNSGFVSNDTTICYNTAATVGITDYTGTSIQWQDSVSGRAFENISATTAQFTTTDLLETTWYRAIVTNGVCPSITGDTVKVTIMPLPTVETTVKDTAVCSDTPVTFNLTEMVITTYGDSLEFCLDKDFITLIPDIENYTQDPDENLTLYVRAVNKTLGCTTPDDAIDSVIITVFAFPKITITPNSYFLCGTDSYIIDVTFDSQEEEGSFEWKRKYNASDPYVEPTGLWPRTYGTIAEIGTGRFFYDITQFEHANIDSIILRFSAETPVCKINMDSITLFINAGHPSAIMEIIEQPIAKQIPCTDTVYTLKIIETGKGGLTHIKVTLNDWKETGIVVDKVEYLYPIDGGTWVESDLFTIGYNYTTTLLTLTDTVKLEMGDSVLVRFSVHTECEFYGGADFRFDLSGEDICRDATMPAYHTVSDIFNFHWGEDIAEYNFLAGALSHSLVTNQGGGNTSLRTITWSVSYIHRGGGDIDPDAERILFGIPIGMTLDTVISTDGSNFYDLNGPIATGNVNPDEIEYWLPIKPGIGLITDTVKFDIIFTVGDTVRCGDYFLFVEIVHKAPLMCNGVPCDFYEIQAGKDFAFAVELYSFELYTEGNNSGVYYGIMDNGRWSGGIEIQAENHIYAGDEIMIIFYADMNNNGVIDAGDIPMDTVYYPTIEVLPGDLFPILLGQVLPAPYPPVYIKSIGVVDSKQLLAHFTGPQVCDDVLPLVTIFGPQHVCQGETKKYYTAPDMEHYSFSVSGTAGAISVPIGGEGDSVAYTFRYAGTDTISVRYHIPAGEFTQGHLLNHTKMVVYVHPYALSDNITINDTTICFNTSAELVASSTSVINPIFRWYASETAVTPLFEGNPYNTGLLTSPANYYVSVIGDNYCENHPEDRVKVSVAIVRNVPTISISTPTPTVCTGTSVTFTSSITGGGTNPGYVWYRNGASVPGATSSQFTYIPNHNDFIYCVMHSSAQCANPAFVTSTGITMTVLSYPAAPEVITETLDAFPGSTVNLLDGVAVKIPGMTYHFYENPDKTNPVSNIIEFVFPKDDYYVAAHNGYCEGAVSQIILRIPCPEETEDIDGNVYKVTALAGLCWTENLRSTRYSSTGLPVQFYYTYTCIDCPLQLDTIFGYLYNWRTAVGEADMNTTIQGICPDGYHIPSKAEWSRLERYDAMQLKSAQFWLEPPGSGTDDYGFTAFPAGWFAGASDRYKDLYGYTGWWASDDNQSQETASSYAFSYYCNMIQGGLNLKIDRLSVRCVLDY